MIAKRRENMNERTLSMLWADDKRILDTCREELFDNFFDEFNDSPLLDVFDRRNKMPKSVYKPRCLLSCGRRTVVGLTTRCMC